MKLVVFVQTEIGVSSSTTDTVVQTASFALPELEQHPKFAKLITSLILFTCTLHTMFYKFEWRGQTIQTYV